jgi:hypothetical protein
MAHVESDTRLLFDKVIKVDLQDIVAKRKDSRIKVMRNRRRTGER